METWACTTLIGIKFIHSFAHSFTVVVPEKNAGRGGLVLPKCRQWTKIKDFDGEHPSLGLKKVHGGYESVDSAYRISCQKRGSLKSCGAVGGPTAIIGHSVASSLLIQPVIHTLIHPLNLSPSVSACLPVCLFASRTRKHTRIPISCTHVRKYSYTYTLAHSLFFSFCFSL